MGVTAKPGTAIYRSVRTRRGNEETERGADIDALHGSPMRNLPMSEFPGRLIDGYRGFRSGRLRAEQSRYRELADSGQSPETMVIGCCDSRVSPEIIFDARPGELFVLRNVANLVPPYAPDDGYQGVSAALQFAVEALRVKHLVVLGHARCGGIRAYAERRAPLSSSDFLGKWVSMIAPAVEAAAAMQDGPDFLTRLEHASIATTLSNLMTFRCVSSLVGCGKLSLHGAYFDVATGRLEARDPVTGRFEEVVARPAR
jgi:carbonic anhydrase